MPSEIRHALRRLRATPVVTLSAIACLSIGVWMTCIVGAVGGGYFRPRLGVPAPDRLVQIDEVGLFATKERVPMFGDRTVSAAVLDSLANRKVFAAIGFYRRMSAGVAGEQRYRSATLLSSGMMEVLGVRTTVGRRFLPTDDSIPSMIISEALWRSLFGKDPAVIGRRVELAWPRMWIPIVGVAAEGFTFPRNGGRIDIYLSGGVRILSGDPGRVVLARLRDDQSLDDVRPVVSEIALRNVASDREALIRFYRALDPRRSPPTLANGPVDVRLARYYNESSIKGLVNFVVLVLGCGIAVVLIAASNVVNLLLIRGAARRQEIAVRMALGASRARIARGLVVETAFVAAVGSFLGFAVAFWQWKRIDAGVEGRYWFGDIEWSMLPVALGAGLTLTLLVGVWPGLRATSMNLEQVLRDTRRAGINASPLDTLLGRLVAGATAGTVMLLVCAFVLGLSARDWVSDKGLTQRKGFTSLMTFDESESRAQRAELARQALARVRRVNDIGFAVLGGIPADADSKALHASVNGGRAVRLTRTQLYDVSDGWFDAMNVRLVYGRKLTAKEARDSTNSVVISRSLASTLFGGETAVDRTFRYWDDADSVVVEATVVGVAETQPAISRFQIYRPFGQRAPANTALIVGSRRIPASPAAISKALRSVAGVLSSDVETLQARASSISKVIRYMLIGFVLFAAVGMTLAAIGMYGSVSYSVVRRTHEIGVRIALGADRAKVVWMIVEQGLKVTLIGSAFGLGLSYWSTRLLGTAVENVKVNYPLAMAGVVVLVMLVSAIACLIPGYRAGRLNPVEALRAE